MPRALPDEERAARIQEQAIDQAVDLSIETMGRLAEFWGFTRTMGRVYGALFLSPRPMTQTDLVERLGVSAANVSMSINGLIRWGAVHKVYEKGSRKLQYVAEPELRKIVRNVLGAREQRELSEALETFHEAVEVLKDGRPRGRKTKMSEDASFVEDRVLHLEMVARMSNKMLDLLLGDGRLDVKAELGER